MRSIDPGTTQVHAKLRSHTALAAFPMALALLACGPASVQEEDVGAREQPIVAGTPDTGDPAVVALTANGYLFCTGTLIAPTVVLTAAHCLPPNISEYASSYGEIGIYFGNDATQPGGTVIGVLEGWTHPAWNDQAVDDDIGLVRLAQPGPAVPIPIHRGFLTNQNVGEAVRIVGFGMTAANDYNSIGVKRQADTTIDEVQLRTFTMPIAPSGTCNGDSGGTALMTREGQEVVAGIHSRSDCVSVAVDTRVDTYQEEIDAFVGPATCGNDGQCATGCGVPDPDCPCAGDGLCTEACGDPGSDPDCASCAADGQCETGCAIDPDCSACPADGFCDASCGSDPDCGCSGPTCSEGWSAGDAQGEDYDGDVVSRGCTTRGGEPEGGAALWLLWLLASLALVRRRAGSEARA